MDIMIAKIFKKNTTKGLSQLPRTKTFKLQRSKYTEIDELTLK